MCKKIFKLIGISFILSLIFCSHSFAMSKWDFDNGMQKGIDYFNQGLYYEARDEFQWFCDYNWGSMTQSQQKYALDYLGGTKQAIFNMEVNYVHPNVNYQKFKEMVLKYGKYNKENNWYIYQTQYASDLIISYVYNISSNEISISIFVDSLNAYATVTTIAKEKEWSTLAAITTFDNGEMNAAIYKFFPYTDNWELWENSYGYDVGDAIIYYFGFVENHLQKVAGISIYDLGIYY